MNSVRALKTNINEFILPQVYCTCGFLRLYRKGEKMLNKLGLNRCQLLHPNQKQDYDEA